MVLSQEKYIRKEADIFATNLDKSIPYSLKE